MDRFEERANSSADWEPGEPRKTAPTSGVDPHAESPSRMPTTPLPSSTSQARTGRYIPAQAPPAAAPYRPVDAKPVVISESDDLRSKATEPSLHRRVQALAGPRHWSVPPRWFIVAGIALAIVLILANVFVLVVEPPIEPKADQALQQPTKRAPVPLSSEPLPRSPASAEASLSQPEERKASPERKADTAKKAKAKQPGSTDKSNKISDDDVWLE